MRFLSATAPAWVLIETVTAAGLALASMLVISAVIGPTASGIGAIALAVFLLLDLIGAMLFSDTVVQHRGLEARHVDSAATASVAAGALAAVGLAAAAPLIARAAGQPALTMLLLALAPLLPLSACSGLLAGLTLRRQRYRLLALRVLICQPLALLLGLVVAQRGGGPWAMVALQAANTVGVAILLLLRAAGGLRPRLDRAALAELWPVAGPQFVAEVMRSGRYRVFIMILGATSAPAVVAVCNIAFRLLDQALGVVSGSSARITLPRLARIDDREAMAEAYGELAQFQALLGWPVAAGIALIAPQMIAALLGPQWEGAASAARIAAIASLAAFSFGDAGSLWVAVGKTRMNLVTSAATLLIPVAGLLIVQPRAPAAAAFCWGAASVLPAVAIGWFVLREIGRSPAWLLHRLAPAAIAVAAMTLAVATSAQLLPKPPLEAALGRACIGGVVYLLTAWLALGRQWPAALRSTGRTAPLPAPPLGETGAMLEAGS